MSRVCMRFHAFLLLIAACWPGTVRAELPRCFVATRSVLLSFEVGDGAPVDRVEAWVTTDNGATWRSAHVSRDAANAVRFQAPADGTFGFFLVLVNDSGRSAPPPNPGTPPQIVVVVDTAAPIVQIHGARPLAHRGNAGALRLDVSLIEENLGSGGVRVFYRAAVARDRTPATQPREPVWQDAGIVPLAGDVVEWHADHALPPVVDVRLVATDLAGNQGSDEILGVPTTPPAPSPAQVSGSSPPASPPAVGPLPRDRRIEPVALRPSPASRPTRTPPAARNAADAARPSKRARARMLQQQAARFLAGGKLALAGARIEQALRLVPDDPNLYVDLGGVFFRNRQVDDARRAFLHALELAPDLPRALENLALVEAIQNRYASARAHLKHLVRVEPRAARHWLHLGDVEHVLGHEHEARAAWQRALRCEPKNATVCQKAKKRLALFGPPVRAMGGPDAARGPENHAPQEAGLPEHSAHRRDLRR